MATVIDLEVSLGKATENLKTTKKGLEGVETAMDGVTKASNEAATGQDKLKKSSKGSGDEMKKQVGIIQQMENHLERLEKGQKKATSVKDIKKYNTEIVKTRLALEQLKTAGVGGLVAINTAAVGSAGVFKALKATIATTFAPLIAVGAVVAGLQQIVSLVVEYEQVAADLQAITGVNNETLEFLKQSAVEVALSTTVSAAKTLEAYKLIASAKPELLDNAAALADFTVETIALSEAMGGDLTQAATDLTDIMNKFNAPAEQAGRFINALAAGSQRGSAEVAQLASAILVSGTAAKSSNVSLEETVGLLETLAENGKKGSEAGTGLRTILSKLSATDVLPKDAIVRLKQAGVDITKLSDKTLTFKARLGELQPIQNDSNALTAVFGEENKDTALILIENIARIDELTEAVTGTSTAYEQAAIRTNTLAGEWERLKNTAQALVQSGGAGLTTFLKTIIRLFREGLLVVSSFISVIATLPNFIRDNSVAFKALIAAIVVWNSQMIIASANSLRLAAIEKGRAVITTAITIAQKLLNAAMTANPIGLVIKATALLVAGFGLLYQKSQTVRAGIAGLGVVAKEIFTIIVEAFQSFKDGFNAIKEGDFSGAFKFFKKGLIKSNPIGIALTEGGRLAGAFNKGFKDKVDIEIEEQKAQGVAEDGASAKAAAKAKAEAEARAKAEAEAKAKAKADADKLAAAAARAKAEEAAKKAAIEQKAIERVKLAAMLEGKEKQLALEDARFEDLFAKLEEFGLETESATQQHELNRFKIKSKFLKDASELEHLDGEERLAFILQQGLDEIDALEAALTAASPNGLIDEQQQQLRILRKEANEKYLKELGTFQDDEQEKAEQHEINLLELRREEFKDQLSFEEFKEREILKIRLKFAAKQLELLEKTKAADSDAVLTLEAVINSIKGDLVALDEGGKDGGFNIYKLLGLDPDSEEGKRIIDGLEVAASTALSVWGDISKRREEVAKGKVQDSDEEIERIDDEIAAKEGQLESEKALADQGLNNNFDAVQEEIALLKEQKAAEKLERDKAVAEQQKAARQQAIADSITQGSSLITAAAQVFKSVAAIPFVGVALGAALVATMIGSFVAAKARVFKNITKAKKGMFGKVDGRGHDQGGERFIDHIEVESREAFSVYNREVSGKHGADLRDFTNAANSGDRVGMAKVAAKLAGLPTSDKRGINTRLKDMEGINVLNLNGGSKEDTKLLKEILGELKNRDGQDYQNGVKVIRKKNATRIVRRNGKS